MYISVIIHHNSSETTSALQVANTTLDLGYPLYDP